MRGIDLTVESGEIIGFLGPNGARKTTTLRMLTTLLAPTGGHATVAGCDLVRDPAGVRRRERLHRPVRRLDPYVSVREELTTQGRLYRMPKAKAVARAAELAEDFGFAELMDRPTAALSGGQRRRLDIAMGLMHRPRRALPGRAHHRARPRQPGRPLGSRTQAARRPRHDRLPDHALPGRGRRTGGPADHRRPGRGRRQRHARRAQVAGRRRRPDRDRGPSRSRSSRSPAWSPASPAPSPRRSSTTGWWAGSRHGGAALVELVRGLDRAGITVSGVESRRPSLDDVFLQLTGRSLRDAESAQAAPAAPTAEEVTV